MGRQLNFWMSPLDEQEFIDRLSKDDAVWSPREIAFGDLPVVREFEDWPPQKPRQTIIVIQREYWKSLKRENIKSKPPYDSWTMVGTGLSPCFEWDICKRGPTSISRGRIYYKHEYLRGNQFLYKPDEIEKWFNRLVSWLRRRGTKGKYARETIMPDALRLMENHDLDLNRDD